MTALLIVGAIWVSLALVFFVALASAAKRAMPRIETADMVDLSASNFSVGMAGGLTWEDDPVVLGFRQVAVGANGDGI